MAEPPPYPESRDEIGVEPDRRSPPGLPRWVKVFGIVILVLVLLFVVLQFAGVGGQHGPRRHLPSDAGGDTPTSSVIEVQTASAPG